MLCLTSSGCALEVAFLDAFCHDALLDCAAVVHSPFDRTVSLEFTREAPEHARAVPRGLLFRKSANLLIFRLIFLNVVTADIRMAEPEDTLERVTFDHGTGVLSLQCIRGSIVRLQIERFEASITLS